MRIAYQVLIWLGIVGAIALSLFYNNSEKAKTAYVNVSRLYNEFQYKKELETKLTNVQQQRKTILDSLEIGLKLLNTQIESSNGNQKVIDEFNLKRQEYLLKKQQFDEDNNSMTQQYSSEIMKQLNQYVKDFGKQNEYTYIYGAEGNGSLMYADDVKDITEAVLAYVNERYKGGAK